MYNLIEERLEALISENTIKNQELRAAARYALFPGGKRLRPAMLLSISGPAGLDAACAIEFIHTYSLIHDDLPAMDDDDMRRGKPSLHKAFPESTAILTGDFLLTYAFEILSSPNYPRELVPLIARAIGGNGMIGGQLLDLAAKNSTLPWNEYQRLVQKKTSDLFSASLQAGAHIAGLSSDLPYYHALGQVLGLLFQMNDDREDDKLEFSTELFDLLFANAKHLLSQLSKPNPFLETFLTSQSVPC